MDQAPVVLVALTVAWLSSRWNHCLVPGLRAVGAYRPTHRNPDQGRRKPTPRTASRTTGARASVVLYVGYATPVDLLRQAAHLRVARHPLWDGRDWGLQVIDATRSAVVVRVCATAASPADALRLEADLREALLAYLARYYPESLEQRVEGDGGSVVPHLLLDR